MHVVGNRYAVLGACVCVTCGIVELCMWLVEFLCSTVDYRTGPMRLLQTRLINFISNLLVSSQQSFYMYVVRMTLQRTSVL